VLEPKLLVKYGLTVLRDRNASEVKVVYVDTGWRIASNPRSSPTAQVKEDPFH
jgi:hypothetical protein